MWSYFKSFQERVHSLTLNKQFIFFSGIALVLVALLISFQWIKEPIYTPLFKSLPQNDESDVLKVLDSNSIRYQILPSSGMIMVKDADVNHARMVLAQNNLPSAKQDYFDLLTKKNSIYTSQENQKLIKLRILESNISKAIKTINGIEEAVVQIAKTSNTDFLKSVMEPKASVVLRLSPGVQLSPEQVKGISYLVSSSVPYMNPKDVTIIDQNGSLLTGLDASISSLSADQIRFQDEVEDQLRRQILNVLSPIVGSQNIRVQVNASLDFNNKENTTKQFLPDKNAIESEQVERSDNINNAQESGGVPGSLSNQPPRDAKFDLRNTSAGNKQSANSANATEYRQDKEIHNYSLGQSITHTSFSKGTLKNITVAILLNDKSVKTDENSKLDNKEKVDTTKSDKPADEVVYKPYSKTEIKELEMLAKDAVGFNLSRGDRLTIISQKFAVPEPVIAANIVQDPFYASTWFLQLMRGVYFLVGFSLFIFFIWKPFYNHIFSGANANIPPNPNGNATHNNDTVNKEKNKQEENNVKETKTREENTQEKVKSQLTDTSEVFSDSPDVAAHVIKNWLKSDNNKG